jgi:predicted metalloprotease with PDZ domain
MWLDVDTRLREVSGDTRSLDDFAQAFFAAEDGDWTTRTYDHDEVVTTLQTIAAFDWQGFLADQLTRTHERAPLAGLERGGYRLIYRDEPSDFQRSYESVFGQIDFTHTLGLTVTPAGKVTDVLWDGPAFHAEMTIGAEIVGVRGCSFSPEWLRQAVRDGGEVTLIVAKGGALRTVPIVAPSGLRYPHLARIDGTRARLDEILAPR